MDARLYFMIAALQQIPAGAVNEPVRQGGRRRRRRQEPSTYGFMPLNSRKWKGIFKPNQLCIWIVRIWKVTAVASLIPASTCIIHEVHIIQWEGAWALWPTCVIRSCLLFCFLIKQMGEEQWSRFKKCYFWRKPLGTCSPLNGPMA